MEWIERHQLFLAIAVLVGLCVLGLVVLVVRAIGLYRTTREGMRRVDQPVQSITNGLADAERRVGVIAEGQADLGVALETVGAHTGELKVLVDHAGKALSALRAPFRYLGR